mmetsp:Transcript_3575/g.4919  ORF Transcript_3575/g.4919 Transcript_3575/m.4919 type:complete len:108 (-) Transcript_3575:460-783(-)
MNTVHSAIVHPSPSITNFQRRITDSIPDRMDDVNTTEISEVLTAPVQDNYDDLLPMLDELEQQVIEEQLEALQNNTTPQWYKPPPPRVTPPTEDELLAQLEREMAMD